MEKVKINGVNISYPETLKEITVEKAIKLFPVIKRLFAQKMDEGWFDNIEFLSYFCDFEGISDQDQKYELATQMSLDKSPNGEALFFQLNFDKLGNISNFFDLIPKKVTLKSGVIEIPKDLFSVDLVQGQLRHFAGITKSVENRHKNTEFIEVLKKLSINTPIENFSESEIELITKYENLVFDGYFENIHYLAANILQGLRDENFDLNKADEISKELLTMSALEILPLGFFLLMKLRESLVTKIIFSMVGLLSLFVERSKANVTDLESILN